MSENASILVVEDDAGHFALIRKNLWRTCVGKEIFHYQNGEELLHFLSSRENDSGISSENDYLLLLDIRLPGIDGIEVLRRIRNNTELHKMPVIMLTTSQDRDLARQCYDLGCAAHVVKPPGDVLIRAIQRVCERY